MDFTGIFPAEFCMGNPFTVVSTLICSREFAGIINLILLIVIMFGSYQLEHIAGQSEFIIMETYENVPMTPDEVTQIHDGTFQGSYSTGVDENGIVCYYKDILAEEARQPNPNYIAEPFRSILAHIDNTLPYGQINLYVSCLTDYMYTDDIDSADIPDTCWKDDYSVIRSYPLYSLALIAILSGIGWLVFRKKDLK